MSDFSKLLQKAKSDVRYCLEIWTELLEDLLADRIKYVFAKGSSMKQWETPIDYVPILSDVDIHIMLNDGAPLLKNSESAFPTAINISQKYEKLFFSRNPNNLHMPRVQIVLLNKLVEEPIYVPPRLNDVWSLIGEPEMKQAVPIEKIRQIDLTRLLEDEPFLNILPGNIFDRVGLDFWVIIRRMNWRVSPAPIRLLTQLINEHPQEVWSWNRTKIVSKLEEQGFSNISHSYTQFYIKGWQLFNSHFTDNSIFREIIMNGYGVLRDCLEAVREYM
ncbi:MAG: hypothetical protein ACFFC7_17215 [Candidatus Hermodarchaeota archaeon]